MNIHELVLKPTVTCGSPILRNPLFRVFLKIGYPQNSSVDHSPRYGESMWIVPSFFGPICVQECILAGKMIIYIYISVDVYMYILILAPYFLDQCHSWADGQTDDKKSRVDAGSESLLLHATVPDLHGMCFSFTASHGSIVGGFKHFLLSIIYGIILPIDELIFFKMAIAPPSSFFLVYSIPWFRDVFE